MYTFEQELFDDAEIGLGVDADGVVFRGLNVQVDAVLEKTELFEALDLKWRAISYNLRQIPDLARSPAIQRVERMDALEHQLSDIFKINPQSQFDQRELVRRTASLSYELGNLVQDINLEMVDQDQRRALCATARRTKSQVQMICDSIDTGYDPTEVVGQFKRYQEIWYPFARQLRTSGRRSAERGAIRRGSMHLRQSAQSRR